MRITWGNARFVILIGPYAIKIAKFHFFTPLLKTLKVVLTGQCFVKRKVWAEKAGGTRNVVYTSFCPGLRQNWAEYQRYQRFQNSALRLVPTRQYLYGLVNIQVRGEPACAADLEAHPLYLMTVTYPWSKVMSACQFCNIGGLTYLADIGHPNGEFENAMAAYV